MNADKFEIFADLTQRAFREITKELVSEEYKPETDVQINENVLAIIIGISGNSKGRILVQCSVNTADKFINTMSSGNVSDNSKEKYLYLAEFANKMCQRATTYVNENFKEREFWLTPPAIFSAKGLIIVTPKIESRVYYYSGNSGIYKLDIGFEGEE